MKGKESIKRHRINFVYNNADAIEVRLVGNFNDWNVNISVMKHDGNGTWRKTVMLPSGEYEYKFLVDGQWENDPSNANARVNCFGTTNNLIQV